MVMILAITVRPESIFFIIVLMPRNSVVGSDMLDTLSGVLFLVNDTGAARRRGIRIRHCEVYFTHFRWNDDPGNFKGLTKTCGPKAYRMMKY